MIPLVDLRAQYAEIQEEIDAALSAVVREQSFIKGPHLAEFEEQFAEFCGTRFALGASSGTTAIALALAALDIGEGDEVIVPSHTFFATVEPILQLGARPVFADVDPETYLIDPDSVERCLTFRTRAIMPVHLYGQMADMQRLRDLAWKRYRRVALIEDCAQAHGAQQGDLQAGGAGDIACFSFYPGKNLGAYGDGGAVTTNDSGLAERMAKLADHGRATKYVHDCVGFNYRLDALQAAVLSVKLRHLPAWNERRRQLAANYTKLLANVEDCGVPQTAPNNTHVYHLYVVDCPHRGEMLEHLREKGVGAGVHYPVPVHLQPALRSCEWSADELPHTEVAAQRVLSLPLFPELTEAQQQEVVEALRSFVPQSAIDTIAIESP